MNVVACIKRVPTTDLQPKVSGEGTTLESAGVQYMTSFYDELAVEQALRTKEASGGEVTILTLGPPESTKEVRECLARGADKGVLLVDPEWDRKDCRATAKALAEKIRELDAQLVFTGRVATDRDNASVGPMVATMLGWACVTDVIALEIGDGECTAKREAEAGIESYTFSLPAVITCQKDLNEPRYAGLKGIMAAKKKPIEEVSVTLDENQAIVARLEPPPPRPAGRIVGEGAAAVPDLIAALQNEAKVL